MLHLMRHKICLEGNNMEIYIGDIEITKRELIASISIIAIMLLVGVLISGKISEHQLDRNEVYNKAAKIEDADLFQYGMDTNIGNAFVYGDLQAVDTVTYPEIKGEYMYIKKVKEEYTKHTRQVAHTKRVNGKTQTYYTTEPYWTWDQIGSEEKKCEEISFCGISFDSSKFDIPAAEYVDTVQESSYYRYKYYGTGTSFTGTIFTQLADGTISENSDFYNMDIEKSVNRLESGSGEIVFWILWVALTIACVFIFYYFDNKWLE